MADWIDKELARSNDAATKAGERRLAQPRAVKARYDAREARLVVELSNGVILILPTALLQGLKKAKPAQIAEVRLTPHGTGLHWEELDLDFSVIGLLSGVFGSKAWMRELAHRAGSKSTTRKAAAARENGRKGGRPRGSRSHALA